MNNQTIHIICGPTASGKSARAIDIARSNGGVIINADAMQVYRELRVLTARPTPEEEQMVPHKVYGVLSAQESCSAARWLTFATTAIDAAWAEHKVPVVVGGTGLYLKALIEGLSPIPESTEATRAQATQLREGEGANALKTRDPATAERLKDGDTQRHIRALEIWLMTGRSISLWQKMPRQTPYPHATFQIEQIDIERDELYARCDKRFLTMLDKGALEEVKTLKHMQLSADLPAMRAVGVPELIGYLEGQWTLQAAIEKAQQATRNYAKRQLTWFRNQLPQNPVT